VWYTNLCRSHEMKHIREPQHCWPNVMSFRSILDSVLQDPIRAVDFLIAVIGFAVLWIQIARTKRVATAAKEASESATQLVTERMTISDVATIRNRCGEVQTALRGGRLETALIQTQVIRSQLVRLRQRPEFKDNEKWLTGIQGMVAGLRNIQSDLEKNLDNSDKGQSWYSANRNLGDYVIQLSEWAEHIQFASRSEN